MRYAWHMKDDYFTGRRGVKGWLRYKVLGRLRDWDRRTAERVTHFVAISKTIQQRIHDCYGRDSVVIYPPVDTGFFTPAPVQREDYYLAVSAFAPYKRLDLAIEACGKLKRKLVVIGSGQDEKRLRKLAGPDTAFLGWQPDEMIRDHLRRCRALLFPGEEDFGIVPVEANACGTPVIAFGRGGATETIVPLHGTLPPTGEWFEEQSIDCLSEAMSTFENHRSEFDPRHLRRQAVRFNVRRFEDELLGHVQEVIGQVASLRRAA
jgi:glycosyltransferase involved in cell wall biosynthesis